MNSIVQDPDGELRCSWCSAAPAALRSFVADSSLLFFCILAAEEIDCDKAWTTLAINQCMHKNLAAAKR